MRLKLYRAPGMAEALGRVRAELGPDAIILSSRRMSDGVEITAALEHAQPAPKPPPAPEPDARAALRYHAVPAALHASLAGPLDRALARTVTFGHLPLAPGDAPLLFAGPPGAGKTLTVARLATRLVQAGTPPMIVTADGARAGAIEQLAAFTRLLGISLIVAQTPVMLARALARRTDGAPVLVDTAGCDAFLPADREALHHLAAAASGRIVAVLPAGMDASEAAETAACLAQAGASFLAITRFDLARRAGAALSAAYFGRLCLTEAGIGPGAADGLAPLTPAFLAERLRHPTEHVSC